MMMKLYLSMAALLILLPFSSCRRDAGNEGNPGRGDDIAPQQAGEIVLTREQFTSSGMVVGDPVPVKFSQEINATGYLASAPSGKARISTMIPGWVSQIDHQLGDRVGKGSVLFSLESQEIIMIQEEYGTAFQSLQLLASDYDRLRSLTEKEIAARKDFLKVESEYRSTRVEVEALHLRLKLMGIDPEEVEKGIIRPSIRVRSPVSGIVSRQELVTGQYIEPHETVMEVLDPGKLRLRLQVFEKSMADLATGQEVLFSAPDQPQVKHRATLTRIGRSVDPESRSVLCFAEIVRPEQGSFYENMYVEATVITCERETRAVPEEALLREADRDYALVLVRETENLLTFRKIPVQTGPTRQGFTEVLDQDLTGVLLEGAFNLWMEE